MAWSEDDIEKLMDAFAADNIAPAIKGIAFKHRNVMRLLDFSHCRRCGRCCLPNPLDPEYPGVMVYREDLLRIAEHSRYSYKNLKKKARLNTDPSLARRRYLPFPCMFYDRNKGECQIYEIRPVVCRTFPIIDLPGEVDICVNVICDYAGDIYKKIIREN